MTSLSLHSAQVYATAHWGSSCSIHQMEIRIDESKFVLNLRLNLNVSGENIHIYSVFSSVHNKSVCCPDVGLTLLCSRFLPIFIVLHVRTSEEVYILTNSYADQVFVLKRDRIFLNVTMYISFFFRLYSIQLYILVKNYICVWHRMWVVGNNSHTNNTLYISWRQTLHNPCPRYAYTNHIQTSIVYNY